METFKQLIIIMGHVCEIVLDIYLITNKAEYITSISPLNVERIRQQAS